jgi:hypothetical protein
VGLNRAVAEPGIRVHGSPETVRWSNGILIKAAGPQTKIRFSSPLFRFGARLKLELDGRRGIRM